MNDATDVWAIVRQKRTARWRALAWGPVVLVISLLARHVPPLAIGVSLLWFGWLAVCSFRLEEIRCPRCGKKLFRDGAYHNSLVSRCLHCGQEIGAPVHAHDKPS
jgi:DNA-directed RNA polymerase subunit RPC12/RpoP